MENAKHTLFFCARWGSEREAVVRAVGAQLTPDTIRRKCPDLWADNSYIFHHDNAPSYSSLIVTEFLAKYETKVIAQPPYLPDLASCDFFLFLKLKYPLLGMRHESIQAMKRNSLKELKAIPAEAHKKCMGNWINRWHACIHSNGVYFEGDNKDYDYNT